MLKEIKIILLDVKCAIDPLAFISGELEKYAIIAQIIKKYFFFCLFMIKINH